MPDLGTDELLDAYLRMPNHVVSRSFPGETVVLNLATGIYHGLNVTAERFLDEFAKGRTPREAAVAIAREYGRDEREVQADVVALCRNLLERQLIEVVDAADDGP
jgi:Coenzyme PQQ synthesis protein D (PqqD)